MSDVKTKTGIMKILKYLNPTAVINKELENLPWFLTLSVSGIAYGLLFMQTAMDQDQIYYVDFPYVLLLTFKGLLLGTLGISVVAIITWIITSTSNKEWGIGRVIKAFAMSYTSPLVALIFGLLINVMFGTNTAIAFGVSGLIWALNPMFRTIRSMTKGNLILSTVMITLIGLVTLIAWDALV